MIKAPKHTYIVNNLHPQQAQISSEELTRSIYRILLNRRKMMKKK